jgi:hypothetical protein
MLDHISSSHLVRTCTWVVYGNCSTNGVTQSGNYVKYRFVVKVKICTLIMFSIQMSSYSSKHTYEDILYTTKYASFLLCSQLYHSNLFGSHFASIKLSLADDLDNLCQPKCHSKPMSIIICQEITQWTTSSQVTWIIWSCLGRKGGCGAWDLPFISFFLLCRKDSKLSMFWADQQIKWCANFFKN